MKQRSKRVKALLLVFTTLTIALSGCGNAGDETSLLKIQKSLLIYIARQKRLNSCILWPDIKAIH